MQEVAGGVAKDTLKFANSHATRELGYLFHFKSKTKELKSEFHRLVAEKTRITRLIDIAKMNDEVVLEGVVICLKDVDVELDKTARLLSEAETVDRWFKGWFFSRFKLGRRAAKKIPIVQRLVQDMRTFADTVSGPRSVQDLVLPGELTLAAQLTSVVGGPGAFNSRVTTANQVIQALKDDNITMVGVYGMAGVGKTTLVTALDNHVKKEKIFDEVAIVKLAQEPEFPNIQEGLANLLGLKFNKNDTVLLKSMRLHGRLSNDSKTLVILDNVWKSIELAAVGIPTQSKTCKVLFTTRDLDVCNFMETHTKIEVTCLTPEESWNLFRQKAGDAVDSPALQPIAEKIVKICDGLPLALGLVGLALYGKDKTIWSDALRQLQRSISKLAGMPAVISCIKLSYDYLVGEEYKMCFLFCSLFPDRYPITMEQLFHYMVGENLLTDVETLVEGRGSLHSVVGRLTSSGLLLKNESGCVRMHDLVRETAISIASDCHGFMVKTGITWGQWPAMELGECKRLSLSIEVMDDGILWAPPFQIKAKNLLTLSFHGNGHRYDFLSGDFEEMSSLMTLDLSYCSLPYLPESLKHLVSLRTLRLDGCSITSIHLSNELRNLEILSLRYSDYWELVATGVLPKLKLVDLSYTSNLGGLSLEFRSKCPKLKEVSHLRAPTTDGSSGSSSKGVSAV